ncbi:MAG: hypothetical protein WBO23_09220 [Burkholderiales bacterium]
MSPSHTGAILLKCTGLLSVPQEELQLNVKVIAVDCLPLSESIAVHAALEGGETYAYLFSREPGAVTHAVLASVLRRARALPAFERAEIHAVRLKPMFDLAGASRVEAPLFHYVVETDVDPEHEADMNAWYDTEHLPGLAACPGSARARRFRNPDGSPRYHACYDLVNSETLGSGPWLAVRNTAWSDRVRPHLRNPKRTLFRRLFESEL